MLVIKWRHRKYSFLSQHHMCVALVVITSFSRYVSFWVTSRREPAADAT